MSIVIPTPVDIIAVCKAAVGDVTKPNVFDRVIVGLTNEIKAAAKRGEKDLADNAARFLKANWPKLTPTQKDKILDKVADLVKGHHVVVHKKVKDKLRVFGMRVAASAKKSFVKQYHPDIVPTLALKDRTYINQTVDNASWWVRDAGGRISDEYRVDAEKIIKRSARQGFSAKQTSEELEKRLQEKTSGQSKEYFRVVASAAMTKARSWGSLTGFQEAGIKEYVYTSILDEVTTDTCRYLHGQRWSVDLAMEHMQAVEREAREGDREAAVKTMSPWMNTIRVTNGEEQFFIAYRGYETGRWNRVAEIEQSAVGQRDQVGQYRPIIGRGEMQTLGMQYPPLHGH